MKRQQTSKDEVRGGGGSEKESGEQKGRPWRKGKQRMLRRKAKEKKKVDGKKAKEVAKKKRKT